MRLDNLPVLAALKDSLDFNAARARVLAANVANSDTAGYTPKDIADGDFSKALADSGRAQARAERLVRTDPRHLEPPSGATRGWRTSDSPDTETTLDGNAVVLEEQMAKVAETRTRYETAIGLYQKTLGLIRLAVKAPGR